MAKRSRAEFSATELLDDKFQSMQDAYGMSDTLVLPARVKKEKGAKAPPPPPQTRHERRKSKSQEKKIAKLEEVRVKKERRSSLFDSLKRSELTPEERALLLHSGALGHKLTAKEQVTRALRSERLGLASDPAADGDAAVSKSARLYAAQPTEGSDDDEEHEQDGSDGSSDDEDGSSDGDVDFTAKTSAAPARAPAGAAKPAAAAVAASASGGPGGGFAVRLPGAAVTAAAPPKAAAPTATGASSGAAASATGEHVIRNRGAQKRAAAAAAATAAANQAFAAAVADAPALAKSTATMAAGGRSASSRDSAAGPPAAKRVRFNASDEEEEEEEEADTGSGSGSDDDDDESEEEEVWDIADEGNGHGAGGGGRAATKVGAAGDSDDDDDADSECTDDVDINETDSSDSSGDNWSLDDDDDGDEEEADGEEEEEEEDDDDDDDDDEDSHADAPSAPLPPSAFSFAIKLPGKTTVAPASTAPVAAASVPAASVSAHGLGRGSSQVSAAAVMAGAIKADPALVRLQQLRERNERARALGMPSALAMKDGGDGDGDDGDSHSESGDGDENNDGKDGSDSPLAAAAAALSHPAPVHVRDRAAELAELRSQLDTLGRHDVPLATAADVVLAREIVDGTGRDRRHKRRSGDGDGGDHDDDPEDALLDIQMRRKPGDGKQKGKDSGGEGKASGKRSGMSTRGGDGDQQLDRASHWSADGTRMVVASRTLPVSAYAAYAPCPRLVRRDARLQEDRLQLPVTAAEADVMDAVRYNDVVLLCGETGSGKTTQVPQFLYEAGYATPVPALARVEEEGVSTGRNAEAPNASFKGIPGMIAVTQPRRVAATAMAARVGAELASSASASSTSAAGGSSGGSGSLVAYQVRYDSSTVGRSTAIVFLTDGVLLREITSDLLLRRYSAVIVDEAHERGVNTDVLIGLLSRSVHLRNRLAQEEALDYARKTSAARAAAASPEAAAASIAAIPLPLAPLKLIVMSATLRVTDFTANSRLFPVAPPVVHVAARQYPVTVHFSRKTELVDYVGAAYKKAAKIHTSLPEGGILIFLTGQDEIEDVVARLTKRFDQKAIAAAKRKRAAAAAAAAASATATSRGMLADTAAGDAAAVELPAGASGDAAAPATADATKPSNDEGPPKEKDGHEEDDAAAAAPVHVLPLFSLLPKGAQMRVFEPPPEGHRLIVVATNVAETSLTIPGIRYVVDAGRSKRRVYDPRSGASSFVVDWISRASADQRAGRAGRTGPGHCYRLYSSAVYSNDDAFPAFDAPELTRTPLESVVLSMKNMGIASVAAFPFPTPPPPQALYSAVRSLANLGALVTTTAAVGARASSGGGSATGTVEGALLPGLAAPSASAAAGAASAAATTDPAVAALQRIVEERITPLGQQIAHIPLHPSLAKVLVLAKAMGASAVTGSGSSVAASLLDYAIALVAGMTIQDPFVRPSASLGSGKRKAGGGAGNATARTDTTGENSDEEGDDDDGESTGSTDDDEDEDGESAGAAAALVAALHRDAAAEDPTAAAAAAKEKELRKAREAAEKLRRQEKRNAAAAAHARFRHPQSDSLTLLRAIGAHAYAIASGGDAGGLAFCRANWLRHKSMLEAQQLRRQLHALMHPRPQAAAAVGGAGTGSAGGAANPVADVDAGAAVVSPDAGGGDIAEEAGIDAAAPVGSAAGAASSKAAASSRPFCLSLPPPTPAQEAQLRQLVAAGQVDRVAKRAPPETAADLLAAVGLLSRKGRVWVPYLPCSSNLAPPLFLHMHSSVYDSDASLLPPFVCFTEVVTSTTKPRSYMRGITVADEEWLHRVAAGSPLCKLDAPLQTPVPRYDAALDGVVCWRVPTYGDRTWRLPPAKMPFPQETDADRETALRYFGRSFVDGTLLTPLEPFVPRLTSQPALFNRGSALLATSKKVQLFVQCLLQPPRECISLAPVNSKAKLAAVWARYPAYLQTEYKAWLPHELHATVDAVWPQLVAAVVKGAL